MAVLTKKTAVYGLFTAISLSAAAQDGGAALERHWDLLDQYCVECHNFEDWAGGFSLEGLGPDSLSQDGALWEEVIRKLNAGMMPPDGQARPAPQLARDFVASLENRLDQLSFEKPNPGSVVLHRLNRTEYANAIQDMLGLTIDPAELLPRDDESHGFDNLAEVLKVSPSFLEQYILAAREVSVLALGKGDAAATAKVYTGAPNAGQHVHIDGLPLGTRGGMVVEHFFPADGEYEFSINGLVGAGYVWGVMEAHTLMITIDDVKVFEQSFGGSEDLKAVDLLQAEGVGEINGRFKNIRRFVSAGPHRIGVTYLAKSAALSHEMLHTFVPVEGMQVKTQGVSDGPRIDNIVIRGPFSPRGVSATPSRAKLFSCYPEQEAEELSCATEILARIARQAFRRPISEKDLQNPLRFFASGRSQGGFDMGIQKALLSILASPKFLYRAHTPPVEAQAGDSFAINPLDLASRLAFFLWSSLPDAALLSLAQSGELDKPEILEQQVRRMLADPRAESLVNNFAFQWFNVKGLEQVNPDPNLFPQFTYDLIGDFETELAMFIASIFADDRPIHELLTADYTFVNERLALHYGYQGVRGGQFQRLSLENPQRWGLLGKGAILMATSYANRTSPVVRGAYILDKFIGAPPPSPPPNVEAFPETEEGAASLTVRERLESHRANPACNSCHAVIDPLGLALENYNAVGQWRDKDRDAGAAIDASGRLTDGTPLRSPADLRDALVRDPRRFAQTFTEKMMTFALGREVEYFDMATVRAIVREAEKQDFRLSAIVLGIVNSQAFRFDTVAPAAENKQIAATPGSGKQGG